MKFEMDSDYSLRAEAVILTSGVTYIKYDIYTIFNRVRKKCHPLNAEEKGDMLNETFLPVAVGSASALSCRLQFGSACGACISTHASSNAGHYADADVPQYPLASGAFPHLGSCPARRTALWAREDDGNLFPRTPHNQGHLER